MPDRSERDRGERGAYIVLRATLGIIFVSHGAARLYHVSVSDFGAFLEASGLPAGLLIAWTVTLGEIVSGTLLAAGIAVRYTTLFHALVIAAGIPLVHRAQGWFTVGHGTGGIEYSVLILAVLAYLFARPDQPSIIRRGRPTAPVGSVTTGAPPVRD